MNTKRLLSLMLAILLAFTFVSCAEPETPKFTVTFEGIEQTPITVSAGEKFKLPTELPTKEGYDLIIMMGDTSVVPGTEYDITADTVLKCSWKQLMFTVNIDGMKQIVGYGDFKIPAKNGYYTESVTCGDKTYHVNDIIKVTDNLDLVYNSKPGTADLDIVDGTVNEYCGENTEIVIPDTLEDGTPITGIAAKAFSFYGELESITIGNNVKTIGEKAFYDNSSLNSIIMGNSVTDIGNEAFGKAGKLSSVIISDSVVNIGYRAFYNSKKLSSVTIGKNVAMIGEKAFQDCVILSSVTFPEHGNLREISDFAFNNCQLVELDIPVGTKKIGTSIATQCENLKKISIPSSITEIAGNPITVTSDNVEISVSGNNFKVIDGELLSFDGKTLITGNRSGSIPEGVEIIAPYAFYKSLDPTITELTLPDYVTEIGNNAFSGNSLTKVKLGKNLKSIGESSFSMGSLSEINFNDMLEVIGPRAFSYANLTGIIKLPEGLKILSSQAFDSAKGITELHIPSSIEEVGAMIAKFIPTAGFKFVVDKTEAECTGVKWSPDWNATWENNTKVKHAVNYKAITP